MMIKNALFVFAFCGLSLGLPMEETQINWEAPADSRLIELSPGNSRWMTEKEIDNLIQKDIPFVDITTFSDLNENSLTADVAEPVPLPSAPRLADLVKPIIGSVDTEMMRNFLVKFSSFQNRYYKSNYGKESSEYLFGVVKEMADNSNHNITIRTFEHSWPQNSIIARFEPCKDSDLTVIVGAHQDSINGWNRMSGRAPGADDDGSGTTSTLEAFRLLTLSPSFCPDRAVEFHWYSAEEVGLWGSQAVASEYKKMSRKVVAMLQNDMTGYVDARTRRSGKPHFGIAVDFVDKDLTDFVKKLMKEYTGMDYLETRCGYGCSDHASWNKAGYRSAFPIEGMFGEMNKKIHSAKDTVENVDFDHAAEFSKLSVAFAFELGYENQE